MIVFLGRGDFHAYGFSNPRAFLDSLHARELLPLEKDCRPIRERALP